MGTPGSRPIANAQPRGKKRARRVLPSVPLASTTTNPARNSGVTAAYQSICATCLPLHGHGASRDAELVGDKATGLVVVLSREGNSSAMPGVFPPRAPLPGPEEPGTQAAREKWERGGNIAHATGGGGGWRLVVCCTPRRATGTGDWGCFPRVRGSKQLHAILPTGVQGRSCHSSSTPSLPQRGIVKMRDVIPDIICTRVVGQADFDHSLHR